MNNNYINTIRKKINEKGDNELTELVNRLIDERNTLLELINIDYLTGVYNRRIMNNIKDYSVVVICDIDDFKNINDTYGHDIGDLVLKVVANILINIVMHDGVVCRYGGDEFFVMFKTCSKGLATRKIKKAQEQIKRLFEKKQIDLTISAGVAERKSKTSLEDTITNADRALYESKSNGKNTVTLFDEIVQSLKLSNNTTN